MPSGVYERTIEYRKKLSEACKGKILSLEHRKKLSEAHLKNPTRYWLGKKRSKEDIEKFRKSHLGKKQTKETILKRIKKGAEHYNWQGGITPETRKRTRGTFWKRVADKIRERDNNTCQICGLKENLKKLPVHHIIPFKISKNNKQNNLITVCQSCHMKTEWNIGSGNAPFES